MVRLQCCSLVDRYWSFGRMCCLHHQDRRVTVALKMEAVGMSETPIPLQTARSHSLVNCDHSRFCYNTVTVSVLQFCVIQK